MKKSLLTLSALLALSAGVQAQDLKSFQTPPESARPRVWWHWMNGNITKDGIKKDLLWMKKSGIAGFHNFDAGLATPQIVDHRLEYMTPEWKDAFKYSIELADSLGMEVTIASAPGWSATGGPWVKPENAMKRLSWRECTLTADGKKVQKIQLPTPYSTVGIFQNYGGESVDVGTTYMGNTDVVQPFYRDIKVIAVRIPSAEKTVSQLGAKVTSSDEGFTVENLTDGDLTTGGVFTSEDKSYVQYEFPQAVTIKAISVEMGRQRSEWQTQVPTYYGKLQASDDGVNFRDITLIPDGGVPYITMTIPTTTAKYFRLSINKPEPKSLSTLDAMLASVQGNQEFKLSVHEFNLYTTSRINHAEEKSGFSATWDLANYPTPATQPEEVIAKNDVVDVTEFVNKDTYELNWKAPAGNWRIYRIGYGLTGKKNHPASPEATGLEVDKLDPIAWKNYFDTYFDMYKEASGGLMGAKGIQYVLTDSYEAGPETWTPAMMQEFQKRRGYDMTPWMPVLLGQIVGSAEESEKFLWDWRKTHQELLAEGYDQLTEMAKARGMKGRYSEAHENGRLYLVDGMDVKRTAAYPMSAMWTFMKPLGGSSRPMAENDIHESASVAHIYGQNKAAAESMTAIGFSDQAWNFYPQNLKQVADAEMAAGLNMFVIHESAHQPVDDKQPGLGLMIFGQWFNRHDTWANKADVWMNYLGRSCYMLQQGNYVADVLYYYGEDTNVTAQFGDFGYPAIPQGYSFDYINPDALIRLVSVKDGKLVTPSGMRYSIIYLDPNVRTMSLPVLRKLAKLAEDGAIICGYQPEKSASLTDDTAEFKSLVDKIWHSGRANVYTSASSMQTVLNKIGVQPDFMYDTSRVPEMKFVHRHTDNSEIYWVNKHDDQTLTTSVSFRVTGLVPEIWHPETGAVETATYQTVGDRTIVDLNLVPDDAVFVVFKKTSDVNTQLAVEHMEDAASIPVTGDWNVAFQSGRGAPATAVFSDLKSYTENADNGIKYFSGEATYTKTITLNKKQMAAFSTYVLDLGTVGNMAEVTVNGQNMGTVWKFPYKLDISSALKVGENTLEIKVINPWTNRLIGDMQPDVKRLTYTSIDFYKADSPLVPSGLMGPVQILAK